MLKKPKFLDDPTSRKRALALLAIAIAYTVGILYVRTSIPDKTQSKTSYRTFENAGVASESPAARSDMATAKIAPEPGYPPSQYNTPGGDRKITESGYITFETEDLAQFDASVRKLLSPEKGYVFNSNEYDNTSKRVLTLDLKVKTSEAQGFFETLKNSNLGYISNVSYSQDDITLQYSGTKARLDTLKVKEARLTALLEKATRVEDIINIENQLQITKEELTAISQSMAILENQVEYSDIHVTAEEKLAVKKTTRNIVTEIEKAIRDSITAWADIILGAISAVIFLLPVIIIGYISWIFHKKRNPKLKKPTDTKPLD